MQFKEIPRKIVVAKRLSQCLNPALPSGVHQRALDVYSHILAVVGSEGLKRDMALWASGLFPFLEYAATSVKPTLLNICDTYFLPLQAGLRPIMKSFILALLPGLEEETGEFFDKVLSLLDRLSGTVSPSFFLQNIWLVMLTTPSARGTSLTFLSRRLPRLNGDEVGRDIGLMIRAFAAALEDDNLLVRRSALDLLLQSLRMDNAAVQKASAEDRAILMRAATSVVMRRDSSLNRRLYTWLLGPQENSEQQTQYFKSNALELLRATLQEEMFSPSAEYSESRPFKIFISLLDKWEVGGPLTEVLVLDAFNALKKAMLSSLDNNDEIVMTASTLYQAVEPRVVWRQLLGSILQEIIGDGIDCEAIHLARFILTTFHVQDDEIQTLHFPLVFAAVVEIVKVIPFSHFFRVASIYNNAVLQYQFSTSVSKPSLRSLATHFTTAFKNVVELSIACAKDLCHATRKDASLRDIFVQSLLLVTQLVEGLGGRADLKAKVDWDPVEWLAVILTVIEQENTTFIVVDRVISLVIALHHTSGLEPGVSIQARQTTFKMIHTLFRYLRPNCTVYHARAVNLIWALENVTKRPYVESIVAQGLTSPQSRNVQESYEAFGVFWRLTEDSLLPGFHFKVPIMIVLDTLKSDDPNLRRVGETWMRCSLKSYLRVLDPILFDLLDPALRRTPSVSKINGKELRDFSYERPIDQSYITYLLETLLSIVRFGGQGFSKTARTSHVRRSHHAGLVERIEACNCPHLYASFLRFLQSECKHRRVERMGSANIIIQSTAIDLLQAIVARGDVDGLALEGIEAAVIGKLYFSVHMKRIDLQNKLLHLLHSVISATTATATRTAKPTTVASVDGMPERPPSPIGSQELGGQMHSVNPLLVQTLIDGIAVSSNRPVLQHWLDFILMTVPQFQHALQAVVSPLSDCVGRQLRSSLADISRVFTDKQEDEDLQSMTTDADFTMLLNALERLIILNLKTSDTAQAEDDSILPEKSPGGEGGGLLGMMTTVFGSETIPIVPEEQMTARSPGYRSLHEGIRVLYTIWSTMTWPESKSWTPKDDSLSMICSKSRLRCRRVFEHFFRVQAPEVLESIIDCWNRDPSVSAFELVDALTSSAQSVVHMVCESISCRVPGLTERGRKQVVNPDLNLFRFLEQYLQQLEGPLALQVWGRLHQLAKDILGNLKDFKNQLYPVLRCVSVLADKMTQTTAMEDRRVRKELQDTFGKLLDSVVVSAGRNSDQSSWIRRGAKESLNGRDSPVPRGNISTIALHGQINRYVASTALPSLRRFLMDNDKITAACVNIVYYIITPSMKGKPRPLDVDDIILQMILEMSRIPAALKAWRSVVSDILSDNRFFNSPLEAGRGFRSITKALIDTDKTAFSELLGKVTTAPSTNIFTNREYENLLRSLNLRRLSYALYCGEKNQFLTSLPTVQEKLVDVLRNVPAPIVQAEVYLCVRVLLCRLSAHNLVSFWPVILTEMYRLLDQLMTILPTDGSEDLPLVLSACKFLDLLLVLQTEDFQVYQWIFITDTVDAVYRPDDWLPEAMFDQLAEIGSRLPITEGVVPSSRGPPSSPLFATSIDEERSMRRPMLNDLRQIDSIRDLVPFFSSVSIASYESVYMSGGNIDWEEVERGLVGDMFEGTKP
ncbi:hypothetical protein HETIRDRAFT_30556 [Heterobasidion irregulare TC 32-1]|uniref:Uncharacterized protein n=1 Tax=Heterobasidion irregulare (strain TC 32-1) TaxID=747525 RepID=W4KM60_HETIT|nr:uncharacterized protein HETIRDRAFT_30556 [Heterobasidion irregulare TC 32-1]ETW86774.1 hypothetical protein HETIRDRAFT_30556 [Heterobasidion irregulare TC 32-1]